MTSNSTEERVALKPCPVPWCQGAADADWYAVGEQDCPYWVRCGKCGCKTPKQYSTVREACEAWNTRPDNDVTEMCDACDGSGFGVADTYCGKCGGAGGYPRTDNDVSGLVEALEVCVQICGKALAKPINLSGQSPLDIATSALAKHRQSNGKDDR